MYKIYGIKNCDTMKKAMTWLDEHDIAYQFHDYKKSGVDEKLLRQWAEEHGWESLVNRKGTTWRKLAENERDNIDKESAIKLMLANSSLIRRPVLDIGPFVRIGFDSDEYHELFI